MFWRTSSTHSLRTETAKHVESGNPELREFADRVKLETLTSPKVGVVLGSGLGTLAESIEKPNVFSYESIPHFPQPTAIGHAGRLVVGTLNDIDVAMLQGRFHLYEGHDPKTTLLPIQLLHALGIETLVLTNASGGMNPNFEAGDLMVIEDHINLMPFHVESALPTNGQVYDSDLIDRAQAIDADYNLRLQSGTYAGVPGPNYETPAEYRMFCQLGADAVGMSTVLEATFARQLGLQVFGVSVVTNVYRPDVQQQTTGEEVVDVATSAAERMTKLISELLLSCR